MELHPIATVDGTYTLTVNGVGDNVAAYQLVVFGSRAPFIRSHATRGPENGESINEAWFQFDQSMDTSSFSLADDMLRFRGPAGNLQATGFRWETPETLVITFMEQPANHELQMILAPSILSAIGIPLDQNNNRAPGEPIADQYAATLRQDRQGPLVIHAEPGVTGAVPLDRLTFHFNEPIDATTFSLADITVFTGPGGTDLRGQLNNYLVQGRSVTVFFEAQTTRGSYSITIGPNIADLAGNLMDQSRDGVHGQANDSFTRNFELVSSNLRIVSVADPQPATHPTELTFSWQVRNTGNDPLTGTWWDHVYLSQDNSWDLDDIVAARVLYDTVASGALQPGETYTQTVTVDIPGVLPGNYHVIVRSNIRGTLAESTDSDNVMASSNSALLLLPSLVRNDPAITSVNHGDTLYYRYDVSANDIGKSLLFRLDTVNPELANELYVSFGTIPTASQHDVKSQMGLTSGHYVAIADARQGSYFIRAAIAHNGNSSAEMETATVSVEVFTQGEFAILNSYFGQGGTAGQRTIEVKGVNLDRSVTATLVNSSGATIQPLRYYRPGSDTLYVTYGLEDAEPGAYHVQFRNHAGRVVNIPNAFDVINGGGGDFQLNVIAPPTIRRSAIETWAGRTDHLPQFPVTVTWSNNGLNDLRFPLAVFSSTEPFFDLDEEAINVDGSQNSSTRHEAIPFLATDSQVPGLLMPTSSFAKTYRILLRPNSASANSPAYYGVDVLYDEPAQPFNWEGERRSIDPRGLNEAEFSAMFQEFAASMGPANGDFFDMVSSMAFIVPHSSMDPFDAIRLYSQEAFDRFLAQRTASIVGQVQYDLFDIDFNSLRITATHSETFESHAVPVRKDGRFTFPNIIPGRYDLNLDGPAFTTATMSVIVPANGVRNLTIPLLKGASISGTVLTAEGSLLSAARLRIAAPALGISRTISVRPDGSFAAEGLPPATYTLTATASGRESSVHNVTVALGAAATATVQLRLNRATIVSGIVTADGGSPLQNAAIRLFRESTDQTLFGFTDEDGRYSINGVPAGSWSATVSHPDYQDLIRTVSIAGETATHEFALSRGATITGRLLTSQSSPISYAVVTVSSDETIRTALVGENGEFTIGGIPSGVAELRVRAEGYAPLTLEIGAVDVTSDIPLGDLAITTGSSIAGRILNPSGTPIVGATVMLQSNSRNVLTSIPTNENGFFSFELLELGTYRISIGAPGYVSRTNLLALTDSGINQDFVLEHESVLHGTVTGGVGGTVVLYKGGHPVRWAEIDEQGRYRFYNLLAGEYFAAVHHNVQLYPTATINATGGQGTQQDFRPFAGTLSGIVTGPSGQPIPNATVIASSLNPITTVRTYRSVVTDEAGRYQFFGTEESTVILTVVAEGFAQSATTVQLSHSISITVDLAAAPGLAFSGTIVNEVGTGIAIGTIYLLAEDLDNAIPLTAESDAFGNWRFNDVKPGKYELIAVADNHVSYIRKITLTNAKANETVVLPAGGLSLSGTVLLDGLPAANATIQVSHRGVSLMTGQSNSHGRFSIEKLPEGMFTVSVITSNSTLFNAESAVQATTDLGIVELATAASISIPVFSLAGTTGESEVNAGGSNQRQDRVFPPELSKIRDSVSELDSNLYKIDEFYETVRSISWEPVLASFTEPSSPDCVCNSIEAKDWYQALVLEKRELSITAALLGIEKISAGLVDEYYRDVGLGSRAFAVSGLYWAQSLVDDLAFLLYESATEVFGKLFNFATWPIWVLEKFMDVIQRTSTIDFYLSSYESSVVLMERNKFKLNAKVEAFNLLVLEYEQLVDMYERMRSEEIQDFQIIQGPLRTSVSLPKGAERSFDLLSPTEQLNLSRLADNGVSWFVEVLNNPAGSGVTITPQGKAIVRDGDHGNFTVLFQLVLECDDSGVLGLFKDKKVARGELAIHRTPVLDAPRFIFGWDLVVNETVGFSHSELWRFESSGIGPVVSIDTGVLDLHSAYRGYYRGPRGAVWFDLPLEGFISSTVETSQSDDTAVIKINAANEKYFQTALFEGASYYSIDRVNLRLRSFVRDSPFFTPVQLNTSVETIGYGHYSNAGGVIGSLQIGSVTDIRPKEGDYFSHEDSVSISTHWWGGDPIEFGGSMYYPLAHLQAFSFGSGGGHSSNHSASDGVDVDVNTVVSMEIKAPQLPSDGVIGDEPLNAPDENSLYPWGIMYSAVDSSDSQNQVYGARRSGSKSWLDPRQQMDYTVTFANETGMTLPARTVTITQVLDPDLDFKTFQFGNYGFNDLLLTGSEGSTRHRARIDLVSTNGIYIDVEADFDDISGEMRFKLEAIDPETGLRPTNPLQGIVLHGQDYSGIAGFLNYSVRPHFGLGTGTEIFTQTRIVFDDNEPIVTSRILETINADGPTSRVEVFPQRVNEDFTVRWGSEFTGTAPIRYDVFVSENDGPFVRWLESTSDTEAIFPNAVIGNNYAFYSVMTYGFAYREAKPAIAEASTIVVAEAPNAPVLQDSLTGTYWGRSLMIDLMQQVDFSHAAIDPDSIVIASDPAGGSVTLLGDGRIQYDAEAGFVGEDAIEVTVRDVDGRVSNRAMVTIRVVASPAQNPLVMGDVNDDGDVHPLDALLVLVRLARAGREGVVGGLLAAAVADEMPLHYYDVDGNGRIEPLDALIVLTEIARKNRGGSPEGESGIDQSWAVPTIVIAPPFVSENRNDNESPNDITSLALPGDWSREGTAKFAFFDWAENEGSGIALAVVDGREMQRDDADDERELADAVWGQRTLFW